MRAMDGAVSMILDGNGAASKYLIFDPICRRSGLFIKVENGIWVCSPSRRTLLNVRKSPQGNRLGDVGKDLHLHIKR